MLQQKLTGRCTTGRTLSRSRTALHCKAAARAEQQPSLQLATAKLPVGVDASVFSSVMYQWASTLTQSGANYPFALPLQTDKLPAGFKISMLKAISKGEFASAGDIEATVEEIDGHGNILFVRFYEGPAALAGKKPDLPSDPQERLDVICSGLIDVDSIMQSMPRAIRKAVQLASPAPNA